MNNDGTADFIVYYQSLGDYCRITSASLDAPLEGTGQNPLSIPVSLDNAIMSEYEGEPVGAPLATKPPLSGAMIYHATILSRGTLISPTPISGSSWRSSALLFGYDLESAPLGNSYVDGVFSGYVGVYYTVSGNIYYGWLNVCHVLKNVYTKSSRYVSK